MCTRVRDVSEMVFVVRLVVSCPCLQNLGKNLATNTATEDFSFDAFPGTTKDHPRRVDYEYERAGTASIFLFCEPLVGWSQVSVRERRTGKLFASELDRNSIGLRRYTFQ